MGNLSMTSMECVEGRDASFGLARADCRYLAVYMPEGPDPTMATDKCRSRRGVEEE